MSSLLEVAYHEDQSVLDRVLSDVMKNVQFSASVRSLTVAVQSGSDRNPVANPMPPVFPTLHQSDAVRNRS
jgi:hypothetical protein